MAEAEKRDIVPIEYRVRCKNQATVTMEMVGITLGDRFLATCIDGTERNAAQERVRHLALYDPLTDLPNRRLLTTRLEHLMAKLKRSQRYAALMVVDLDNFKPLNDSLGHAADDQVLVEAARRMVGTVREVDTVSRTGGDEFVIFLGEIGADQEHAARVAMDIARRLQVCLSTEFELSLERSHVPGARHRGSASIGVVLFDGHVARADTLFGYADAAMYEVKRQGRNGVLMTQA